MMSRINESAFCQEENFMQSSKSVRLTEGPLFSRIFLYAVPIMVTGILQLIYNAADQMVVGRFSGDPNALGAVGSTSSLNNLIINFLLGFSIGSSVVIAQCYGAKKEHDVSKAVHTSIAISLVGGIAMSAIGFFACEPVLILMGTKDVFIENAVLYTKIICLGIPASSVFNFGATVLRATGDSKTPLIILSITGLANVILNLVFVIVLKLSVTGVALSTITSQYLSALWVMIKLAKSNDCFKFKLSKLGFNIPALKKMIVIGIPSGIQNSLFAISNVTIQTAANTLSAEVISANAISGTIEGFTYTAMHSYQQATITFTGQNYGAGKHNRVKKSLIYCIIQVVTVGIVLGFTEMLFSDQLANIFIDPSAPNKAAVLEAVSVRVRIILSMYFLCGLMEVLSGYLRGLGYSITTMICSLTGACLLRIVWVKYIFTLEPFNNPEGLYLCYPATWIPTCIALGIFCFIYSRRALNCSKSADLS